MFIIVIITFDFNPYGWLCDCHFWLSFWLSFRWSLYKLSWIWFKPYHRESCCSNLQCQVSHHPANETQMRGLAREILWKAFPILTPAYPSISPSTAVFRWHRGCSCWYEPWLDISNDYFDSTHLFRTILGRCFNLKTKRARAPVRRRRMKEVTARETTRMLRSATLTLSKGTTSRGGGMFESWCSWHLSPYQPAGQKHSGAPSTTLKIVLSHP